MGHGNSPEPRAPCAWDRPGSPPVAGSQGWGDASFPWALGSDAGVSGAPRLSFQRVPWLRRLPTYPLCFQVPSRPAPSLARAALLRELSTLAAPTPQSLFSSEVGRLFLGSLYHLCVQGPPRWHQGHWSQPPSSQGRKGETLRRQVLEDDETTAALQGAGEASLDGRPGPILGAPPTKNHMSPLQKQVSPHPGPWEHDNGTRRPWTPRAEGPSRWAQGAPAGILLPNTPTSSLPSRRPALPQGAPLGACSLTTDPPSPRRPSPSPLVPHPAPSADSLAHSAHPSSTVLPAGALTRAQLSVRPT